MDPAREKQYQQLLQKARDQIQQLLEAGRAAPGPVQDPVAVIGMACRFPGAATPAAFWDALRDGTDSIREIPHERWDSAPFVGTDSAPGRMATRYGAFVDAVDQFDPLFFGMTPKEAEALDPQQRLLMEVAWEALENAGQDRNRLRGCRGGVFVGIVATEYTLAHLYSGHLERISPYTLTGTMFSAAAGRLSYFLDWKGPAMALDTSCSSSLTATHLAIQSLRRGESDLALAAGTNLILSPETYVALSELQSLAPDGRCKTFDDRADGFGRGEGCGVLVLKRLADARRDGDPVLAILRGSAVAHNGSSNGMAAPNGEAQETVIRQALADAHVAPDAVDYVEAHGTGTELGDPVEVEALNRVFASASRRTPVRVGSVKTNIGHLEAAAGMAGLIKTILALQHRQVPMSLHFQKPNHHVAWDDMCVTVADRLQEWPSQGRPGVAGVSSFGITGINAHIVVEESADSETTTSAVAPASASGAEELILPLSARTATALQVLAGNYASLLESSGGPDWRSVCYSAATGRTHHLHRLAVVGRSAPELAATLSAFAAGRSAAGLYTGVAKRTTPASAGAAGQAGTLQALAESYVSGTQVSWQEAVPWPLTRKVMLPNYPFERMPLWMPLEHAGHVTAAGAAQPSPVCAAPVAVEAVPAGTPSSGKQSAEDVLRAITEFIAGASGIPAEAIKPDVYVFEMGIDSLMLMRLRREIERRYGLSIAIRDFVQRYSTIRLMAEHIAANASVAAAGVAPSSPAGLSSPEPGAPPPAAGSTEALLREFLAALPPMPPASAAFEPATPVERIMAEQVRALAAIVHRQLDVLEGGHVRRGAGPDAPKARGNLRAMKMEEEREYTAPQKAFIEDVVQRCVARMPGSKRLAQEYRRELADWKQSLGFRPLLKDAIAPIVASRSEGARFWDVDGNEYIDIALGMGVHFLGHQPPFVVEAIRRQLAEGFELGPQSDLAGKVARLVHELTGMERVTLSNTGSEAVMVALRLARAATGRRKVVIFSGAYHGISDGVLAADDEGQSVPAAPGITPGAVEDVLLLDYGTPEALHAIAEHGSELAAVLVEPVQSRKPGLQPQQFLRQLRRITREHDIALIFDEMITGFRIHPGGAQAYFGIKAELAAYGKIVGGGMPIGVVAGSARFMDWVDGGWWQYNDDSAPSSNVTVFGGTFCRHPLALAAAEAALTFVKEQGSALQEGVTRRTRRLCDSCNAFFEREKVPIRVNYFASQFRFESFGQYNLMLLPIEMDLLFMLLQLRGIYTWERRICFLSIAHTDDDVDRIVQAVQDSIRELRAAGFAFESGAGAPRHLLPMTSEQRRLFVLSQREGGEAPYHQSAAFLVDGSLDVERVEECFGEIMLRHESLRTGFELVDGELVQHVHDESLFHVERYERSEADVDALLARFLRPFDLAHPPLLRIGVAHLGPQRHLLMIDGHHIVVDGHALGIVAQEFMALYEGKSLPPVRLQFRDAARRIEEWTASEDMRRQEAYWLDTLAGERPVLNLPLDRPRPARQDFAGDKVWAAIAPEELRQIKDFARQNGVSLFMVLVAAYVTLLHRLTTQEDVVVGIVSLGRSQDGFEDVVGMFANTLLPRFRPRADMSFRELLAQVKQACLDAYDHQEYPFERLVEKTATGAGRDRNALFDTMFSYEKAEARALKLKDATFTPRPFYPKAAMFDFDLEAIEENDALTLKYNYATSLFARETIERWAGYYRRLLAAIVGVPESPLQDIDLMPPEERQRLLVEWNSTAVPCDPADLTLTDVFEEQVARTPDRAALLTESGPITFRELNTQANRVAHWLVREAGVGPDQCVGVMRERSAEMMAAIWGILKAGAAYVPVDPGYPPDRIRYMLENSGCRAVLTGPEHTRADGVAPCRAVDIGTLLHDGSARNPRRTAAGRHMAYVIYTSGSTGRPKGVMVEHHSILNRLRWMQAAYPLGEQDVILQKTTVTFDVSVWELCWWAFCGASLSLLPPGGEKDPAAIVAAIERHKVTTLHFVPTMLNAFLDHVEASGDARPLRSLRHVFASGEALTVSQAKRFNHLVHEPTGAQLHNLYGPTEAAVDVSYFECSPLPEGAATIPIGRPVYNTALYVLDAEGRRLVPTGCEGEVYIGGVQVARGYIGQEALTAERFVPDPWNTGGRLYRTGDRGRWRADGQLEYLGRADFQVKLRGFRIELGEIEEALRRLPEVADAVVVALGQEAERQLVAYLVAQPGRSLSAAAVRAVLQTRLPDYMVPSAFVTLPVLPVLSNGKVDRKALPAPATDLDDAADAVRTPPRDDTERALVDIWCEVLGRKRVGIHDDFFAIGGHSLKAVQVLSRVHRRWHKDVALRDFFAQPTVAELALLVNRAGAVAGATIPVAPPAAHYAVSHAQRQLWLMDQRHGQSVAYNMTGGARLTGELDTVAFSQAVDALIRRHEALRTRIITVGGEPCQKVTAPDDATLGEGYRYLDLGREADSEQAARALFKEEALHHFDLARGPLFRVSLARLSALGCPAHQAQHVCIFNLHHIVGDGWSFSVLMRDLSRLYAAQQRGEPPLPALRLQYRDFAVWHNAYLDESRAQQDRAFWIAQFADGVEGADVGTDFPRHSNTGFEGRRERLGLDAACVARLLGLARDKHTTLFATLLAGLQVWLRLRVPRAPVVIGTPVAGRSQLELEDQVGLYLNTLCLRANLEEADRFTDLLERAGRSLGDAFAHQQYPFDRLVEDLRARSEPGRNPLFDVLLILQNTGQRELRIAGVQVADFMPEDVVTSKVDLKFEWEERAGGLTGFLEYRSGLYRPESVRRFADQYQRILAAVAAEPGLSVAALRQGLRSAAERQEEQAFLNAAATIDEEF